MPAVLMVKGSGLERLLPCLHRCNTIIHRKHIGRKKRIEKNNQIARLTYLFRRNTEKQ